MNQAEPKVIANGEVDVDDQKYIVFKRADWADYMQAIGEPFREEGRLPAECEDAVVIRRKDVFAASGLYAYANSIITGLDIAVDLHGIDSMDPATVQHLRSLADYFGRQADMSAHYHSRKVPD